MLIKLSVYKNIRFFDLSIMYYVNYGLQRLQLSKHNLFSTTITPLVVYIKNINFVKQKIIILTEV